MRTQTKCDTLMCHPLYFRNFFKLSLIIYRMIYLTLDFNCCLEKRYSRQSHGFERVSSKIESICWNFEPYGTNWNRNNRLKRYGPYHLVLMKMNGRCESESLFHPQQSALHLRLYGEGACYTYERTLNFWDEFDFS